MPDDDQARIDRAALEGIVGSARSEQPWPQEALPPGTRVRVIKDPKWDGPWEKEFTGTIDTTFPPRLVEHHMARQGEFAYFVAFDEPQRDSDGDGPYRKAEIWDRYLKPI